MLRAKKTHEAISGGSIVVAAAGAYATALTAAATAATATVATTGCSFADAVGAIASWVSRQRQRCASQHALLGQIRNQANTNNLN